MMNQGYITFRVLHHEDISVTMDAGFSLFFGLHGKYTISTAQKSYVVGASEVYVVSPFTLYRASGREDAGILQITFSSEILRKLPWSETQMIDCYLSQDTLNDSTAQDIRRRCAELFRLYFQKTDSSELVRQAYSLATLLWSQFSTAESVQPQESINTLKLLESALKIIHTQWNQSISLSKVAAQLYVSESYMSRLFKKYLGTTFTKYLVELRLSHAVNDLKGTGSINEIAYRNGFKSDNSFIDFFKKAYGCTPGKYRQQNKQIADTLEPPKENVSEWLQELLQYADNSVQHQDRSPVTIHKTICLPAIQEGEKIIQSWRKMINIGYAHDGLIGSVQEQLRRAQSEIGFTYLRFHGILNDDMHIYQESEDGSPWFNFAYADLLFDFILEIGLIPYVELGYMPSKLARTHHAVFDNPAICISMYNDEEKWQALVQACISHWIDKYSLNNVRKWRFTIFSMNYTKLSFTDAMLTHENYCEIFETTYRTLKMIDPTLQLGGGGCFPNIALDPDGLSRFLINMKQRGCPPDFITLQCYPHENITQDTDFFYFTSKQISMPSVLSKDAQFTLHFLQKFHHIQQEIGYGRCPIVVEEWNSTLWQRDLSNDTCYKAAWLIKNALQTYHQAEYLGYWLLTDFIDEWLVPGGVFHGGYGLFTINGIPKAGYQALRMLSRIGERKVGKGKGWFVSRTDDTIQVYLYHYCHYDALYRFRYQKLIDPYDAYKVFERNDRLKINLELRGLSPGVYRQESWTINRSNGSTFDRWLEMGAPSVMTPEDLKYLNNIAQPLCKIRDIDTAGVLHLNAELDPHEVHLIVLKKRDG